MSELSHGILLQEQGRLEEAEACFFSVLGHEPENDFVYSRLALCQLSQEGKRKEALKSINEAIRIKADEGYYYSVKSLILADLRQSKEALEASETAIGLDPEDALALASKANAYSSMERWADTEEWSRRALSMDSDHDLAANLLTHSLRLQGKGDENQAAVEQQLASNPEDSFAHINAGWGALQQGDQKKAEGHFREALRLDPEAEMAREGLIESFKARSVFYRWYLSYCFFMQRFTGGRQWMIIIGLYVVYQISRNLLERVSPILAGVLAVLWLTLVMWVWLAPGIGNFLIQLDRSARLALKSGEKWQGIAVGGGVLIGILALAGGFFLDSTENLLGVIGFLASAVPASLAFDNESRSGRWIFGAILATVYGITVAVAIFESFPSSSEGLNPATTGLGIIALVAVIACTWLGNVRSLRQAERA
ncbi:MAG: tetratricopeptide repeat protein [Verrucomicrobiota bacterium]